jgi:uncharacterized protein
MKTITYNLKPEQKTSTEFYTALGTFTDEVNNQCDLMLNATLTEYREFIDRNNIEKLRTKEEYAFELLLMGTLWNIYQDNAMRTPPVINKLMSRLYNLRRSHKAIKPQIDVIRGWLATLLLFRKAKVTRRKSLTQQRLSKLLAWLEATGEFKEEIIRLNSWMLYFRECKHSTVQHLFLQVQYLADWFYGKSAAALGRYTGNIDNYLLTGAREHMWKEDVIFCHRNRVEYHLNMVGAEIMNRALRDEFVQREKKIVLAPACMRLYADNRCKSERNGMDIICTECTTACSVYKLKDMGKEEGFCVRLIPHSSDFTDWLKRWEGDKEVGIVGVACVLNLMMGGYEIQSLDISSQCIFLDHAGCEQHWSNEHIPTDVNLEFLRSILGNGAASTNAKPYPVRNIVVTA